MRAGTLIAICLLLQAESLVPLAAQRPLAGSGDAWVPAAPKRRGPDAPPDGPPALPAVADRVTPLTLNVVIRRQPASGPAETLHQTITRTSDRIHIAAGNGREWLLERNPRDARRVSSALVEHASKAIVLYEDSDLRMMLGIRGWVDVLALGFDVDALHSYQRAPETRTLGGIRFARYTTGEKDASVRNVWWSEDQFLASAFATMDKDGLTRFTIVRVRDGADVALLQPPEARYTTYRVFDLANWLERH